MMFRVHPSRFPTSSSQRPRRRFLSTRRDEFILVLEEKREVVYFDPENNGCEKSWEKRWGLGCSRVLGESNS
jgi:hypothetical protein